MNKRISIQHNQKRDYRRKKKLYSVHVLIILIGTILMGSFILGAKKQNYSITDASISKDEADYLDNNILVEEREPAVNKKINDENEWNLILVNPWNEVPDNYNITLTELKNGHAVDERCYPYLQAMIDDCRAEGLNPVICSSYRSYEKQEQLFNNELDSLISQGYSLKNAEIEASKAVAVPGTSEHQLGLAVDIVDLNNQNLNESQERTAVQKWLMENSWKYGFILRYPNNKSDITGIIYEPWHYRYVGKDIAKEIYEQNICLEEYLGQVN